MDRVIGGSQLSGRVRAPPSKSYTHRAILAAGYADGATVRNPLMSADTQATMCAVEAYGGSVDTYTNGDGTEIRVTGFDGHPRVPADVIDCVNSGTTMRLTTGTAALTEGLTVLTGDESLRSRPQGVLLDAIEQLGGRAESTRMNGQAPLVVGDSIGGGSVSIPGDVSSQYVTALLMAGAVTSDGITIELETQLKSAPYVEITRELLDSFGISTERTDDGFSVAGGQRYRPEDGAYTVPGDFSSTSYLLAAGALTAADGLTVEGVYPSAQGDVAIVDILERMGAGIDWDRDAGEITVHRSSLSGVEVDVGDTPDLLPTVAMLGAVASGTTHVVNAEHVRYKETDRVAAMATELEKLGASVTEEQDSLTIDGDRSTLQGGVVEGYDDHRIIMALSVLGLTTDRMTIEGAEHVDVSFPAFFDVLADAGAEIQ